MMNILEILKYKINTIYVKYLNNEEIETLPIHYIGGAQTLPPPLEPKEEEELLEAVLNLELKYRTPIHLYYYEGYSINEIAEILKEKSSTISTRLSRGRKILMTRLGGMFNE